MLFASSSSPDNDAKKTKSKPPPLPASDDPFLLLGLSSPTVDATEIKRAYRKRAMRYHPDVILDADSGKEERDVASRNFARINAAYETLTGGDKSGGIGGGGGAGNASGASSSSYGGYDRRPPHRRPSTSSSSYGNYGGKSSSTNWEDFMPKYDEEDARYDADGDSFGSIFSDMLAGAAGGVAGAGIGGGGGIFGDFVEFLEQNVDGFESGYYGSDDDDAFLRRGSFDEVAAEMDETDVLVSSLETKLGAVENELMQVNADLNLAEKFSERLDLEERAAELKAREKVARGYLKKAKKRLIKLRERYKELIVEGRGGRGYGGGGGGSGGSRSRSGSGSGGRPYSTGGGRAPTTTSSSSTTAPTTSPAASPAPSSSSSTSSSGKSWRNEGFSSRSYGGRSSSGRRRRGSGRASRGSVSEAVTREKEEPPPPRGRSEQGGQGGRRPDEDARGGASQTAAGSRGGDVPVPASSYEPWVPPHRRARASSAERVAEDKKRLRELRVEDDFDRLKKEMGM